MSESSSFMLGCNYLYGENGFGADPKKALEHFKDAVRTENDPDAKFALGLCYEFGYGAQPNAQTAFKWYTEASDGGSADACCNLGSCYERGFGCARDTRLAYRFYAKANALCKEQTGKCHAVALSNMGAMFGDGSGRTQNVVKSIEMLSDAADNGSASAFYNLAYCYLEGIGVNKDPDEAYRYFDEADRLGSPEASHMLAMAYDSGYLGNDPAKAFCYCEKAAQGEIAEAMMDLVRYYSKGIGTAKNDKKAYFWCLKAEKAGSSDALFRLGYFCEKGIGVAPDKQRALNYYQAALKKGVTRARSACERLKNG